MTVIKIEVELKKSYYSISPYMKPAKSNSLAASLFKNWEKRRKSFRQKKTFSVFLKLFFPHSLGEKTVGQLQVLDPREKQGTSMKPGGDRQFS